MDPEAVFENAGQGIGLEVWRIENLRPVPYREDQYGKFYNGDSFIVLNSSKTYDAKNWDIHYWLGSETAQDESDAAAIFSMKLEELLGGAPTLHREVQEHESQQFLSYFEHGVRYLPGGIRTGFARVDPDAVEKRLYHVQGNRNIRLKLVDAHVSSLNKRDCFILDAGKVIYVYVGDRSRTLDLEKVGYAANEIRKQDHDFHTKFIICAIGSARSGPLRVLQAIERRSRDRCARIMKRPCQSAMDGFFDALGSGSPSEVPEYPAGGGNEQSGKGDERGVSLFRVSDHSGHLQVTPVARVPPFEETSLDPDDCFILDTGDSSIFVWIGSNATTRERQDIMTKADRYLEDLNLPKWTHVERVVQGAEPAAFAQYFRTWRSKLEYAPALYLAKLDRPGGDFQVERVYRWLPDVTDREEYNFGLSDFYVDDIMLLDLGHVVYIWQGCLSDEEEKSKIEPYVENFVKRHNRRDVEIVVVPQGDENEEFQDGFRLGWAPEHFAHPIDLFGILGY